MKQAYSDNTGSKYSILIVIATAILLGIIFISLFTSSQILLHNSGLTLSDIFSDRDISITLNSTAAIVLGIATAFITISVIAYFYFVLNQVHKSYKASIESTVETEYIYKVIRSLSNATIEMDSISQTLKIIAKMYDST